MRPVRPVSQIFMIRLTVAFGGDLIGGHESLVVQEFHYFVAGPEDIRERL